MAKKMIEQMVRVNQAGEYGAKRIYEGQLSSTKSPLARKVLRHMADQEQQHLHAFNKEMVDRRVLPTLFTPLWHFGAFALGKVTALMGEKAAMACTVAVEEVIEQHYKDQLSRLESIHGEDDLKFLIKRCLQEELEHKDIALKHGATQAPGYFFLCQAIKFTSKTAIWLSKRF